MSEKIKIVIADDHPIFRKGVLSIVNDASNIKVIGEIFKWRRCTEFNN